MAEEICRLGKPVELSMIFANVSEADIIAKVRPCASSKREASGSTASVGPEL